MSGYANRVRIDQCPNDACGALWVEGSYPDTPTPCGYRTCLQCGEGGTSLPYIAPFDAHFICEWSDMKVPVNKIGGDSQ